MPDMDPSHVDSIQVLELLSTSTSESRMELNEHVRRLEETNEPYVESRPSSPIHLPEEIKEQSGAIAAEENRLYTEEYLLHKKEHLQFCRAHYMGAEDRVLSDYSKSDSDRPIDPKATFLQRVEAIIQREEQDILLVEKFVRGIVNHDQGFSICMNIYFEQIPDFSIWDDYEPLLCCKDSEFSQQLEEYYFRSDTNFDDTPTGSKIRRGMKCMDMMEHFPLVRYVPGSDEDSDVDSNFSFEDLDSSIDAFGNGDERGKARDDGPWGRSDLPNVYLESHRAACGCCLVDFEEPRKSIPPDSASDSSTPEAEAEDSNGEMQQMHEPEPLIQLSCSHVFHKSCLFQSLLRSQECPMCRREISPPLKQTKNKLADVSVPTNELNDASTQPITGPRAITGPRTNTLDHLAEYDVPIQPTGTLDRPTDALIQLPSNLPRDTPTQLVNTPEQLSDTHMRPISGHLPLTLIQPSGNPVEYSDTSIRPTSDQIGTLLSN